MSNAVESVDEGHWGFVAFVIILIGHNLDSSSNDTFGMVVLKKVIGVVRTWWDCQKVNRKLVGPNLRVAEAHGKDKVDPHVKIPIETSVDSSENASISVGHIPILTSMALDNHR